MKKILYSSIAVLFAALMVSSCAKVQNEIAKPQEDEILDVTIIAGNPVSESATKTEIVGTTPYWSVGDRIGVSDGESNNQAFDTDIVSPATTAAFSGNLTVGNYYAYYPYTDNGVGLVNEKYGAKVDLPANQNPTSTSFDGAADVMVSKPFAVTVENPTISDLQFARLGAIVKIILIDAESTMVDAQHPSTVSMTAASNLAGRVVINMKDQCLEDPYYAQSMTVTANYSSGTKYEIDGTNATYLVVVPQTLAAGSTLTIAASTEDYSIEKAITIPEGGLKLSAGKITTLKINLGPGQITSSSGAALPFIDNMSWADSGANDSTTDIGASIADASNSNGLYSTGTKAYKGVGGRLKLGTNSASGSITTKELNLNGAFNIAIKGGKYGSDTGTLEVSVDETKVITGVEIAGIHFVNIPAGTYTTKSKVTIATSEKRGYIYSVKIKSGDYVPDPIINVTSSNPMEIANTATSQTIMYSIDNATEASLTAALKNPADTWISNIDFSSAGVVTFDVAAQEGGATARSAVIVLSYTGADDVEVTVNQAAGTGASYDFETIASLNALVTSTSSTYNGYLTDAIVSYVPATNTAIIKDATGSIMYYKSGHGLKQGQTFTGEIQVTAIQYNSLYSEITAMNASFTGSETVVDPENVALSALVGNYATYQNAYVRVAALTVTAVNGKNLTVTDGANSYVVYCNYGNATNSVNDVITAVGTVTKYGDTEEIKVWKEENIVTSSTPKTVTFTQPTEPGCSFTVKVGGATINSGDTVEAGETVTLTATAGSGYSFSSWNVTGASVANASASETTFTMGDSPVSISAAFSVSGGGGSYTITFANNANSATTISSNTQATTVIAEASRDYVTAKPFTINSGNCYYGDTQQCIRIGKSGNSSSLSIALSASGKVTATSIVVNCNNTGGKNNSNATLNVNSIGVQTTTESQSNYTFTFDSATAIESITLEGSASIRIYSITVNY